MDTKYAATAMAQAALDFQREQSTAENKTSVCVLLERLDDGGNPIVAESAFDIDGDDGRSAFDCRVGKLYIPLDSVTRAMVARKAAREEVDERTRSVWSSDLYEYGAYTSCDICESPPPPQGENGGKVLYRAHVAVRDISTTSAYSKAAAMQAISELRSLLRDKELYVQP